MKKSEKNGYRSVEFAIHELDGNRWEWFYYPKKEDGEAQRGEVNGTRDEAEVACKKAIDAYLDGESSN